MDDSQDDDRSSDNAEDGAVGSVEEMAIGCPELFVFGDQWATFRGIVPAFQSAPPAAG